MPRSSSAVGAAGTAGRLLRGWSVPVQRSFGGRRQQALLVDTAAWRGTQAGDIAEEDHVPIVCHHDPRNLTEDVRLRTTNTGRSGASSGSPPPNGSAIDSRSPGPTGATAFYGQVLEPARGERGEQPRQGNAGAGHRQIGPAPLRTGVGKSIRPRLRLRDLRLRRRPRSVARRRVVPPGQTGVGGPGRRTGAGRGVSRRGRVGQRVRILNRLEERRHRTEVGPAGGPADRPQHRATGQQQQHDVADRPGMSNPSEVTRQNTRKRPRFSPMGAPATKEIPGAAVVRNGQNHRFNRKPYRTPAIAP